MIQITINIFNRKAPKAVVVKGIEKETLLIHASWHGANKIVHYEKFLFYKINFCLI
jgi:hypothetical protein